MIYFQSLTKSDLEELFLPLSSEEGIKAQKKARLRAKQVYKWVYQRHIDDWDQMTDVSKQVRAWLKDHVELFRLKEKTSRTAVDGTVKFLWSLQDEKTIESVIIPAAQEENSDLGFSGKEVDEKDLDQPRWTRLTACISSQVGCAMACKFCLTGVQGLDRHLKTHEVVSQVHELRRLAPITNVVFMGMGEPLHNFDAVSKAAKILIDQDGLGLSKRKVTISTSGLVPQIEKLGQEVDVSLAISLNASTDEQRSEIMPVNKRWNLAALMKACRNYPLGPHRRITFEYVMIRDFNDTLEDAERVLRLVAGIPCKVNLIPFNEHPGVSFKRPSDQVVRAFQRKLLNRGLTTTVRISRGRDILAACGQLRSILGTARGSERHRDWALDSSQVRINA